MGSLSSLTLSNSTADTALLWVAYGGLLPPPAYVLSHDLFLFLDGVVLRHYSCYVQARGLSFLSSPALQYPSRLCLLH